MSIRGSTSRVCYVIGCNRSDYQLRKWKDCLCPMHGQFQEKCPCPPPFDLFTFPTKKKHPERRQRWLRIMKRASATSDYEYHEPSLSHRVCSDHFVDGRPTMLNPDPTLKLGYTVKHVMDESAVREGKKVKRLCKAEDKIQTYTPTVLQLKLNGIVNVLNPTPQIKTENITSTGQGRNAKRVCETDEESGDVIEHGYAKPTHKPHKQTASLMKGVNSKQTEFYAIPVMEVVRKVPLLSPPSLIPSEASKVSTASSLWKIASQFIIYILLCLIRKYKSHVQCLEEENTLLKAKIDILTKKQCSCARTKSLSSSKKGKKCS